MRHLEEEVYNSGYSRRQRPVSLHINFRNTSLEEGQSVLVFGLVFKIENKI